MIKKSLLLMLLMALLAPWAANAQETLTVYDGTTTNNVIPAYVFYFDDFTRSQHVIPADDLAEMTGGTIESIKYYTNSENIPYTSVSTVDVYLMEVSYTEMTALEPKADDAIVYQGTLDFVTEGDGGSLTITLVKPYTYGGGNLLVGIENTTDAGYKNIKFYGQTVSGASWGGSNSSSLSGVTGSQRNFIPKTTFFYQPAAGGCDTPTSLVADPVEAHEATLTWDGGSGTYNLMYKKSTEDWDVATTVLTNSTAKTYTLSGIAANTTYNARVQSVCTGDVSSWRSVTFTTAIACQAPTGLAVTLTPGDGTVGEFSWTETGTATNWQLCLDGDEDNLIDMDSNPFTYDQFTPEKTYTAKVRAYCDAIDQSTWSNTITFTPTDAYSITVNDGTATNSMVPVYGNWVDSYTKCQFVIPASELNVMQYGNINKMTFYSSTENKTWGAAEFDILLTEVNYTTFESATLVDWADMEQVYHGALSISDNKMEIVFDNDYQYLGGNLLVGFHQTVTGSYGNIYWYGISSTSSAIGGYESGAKSLSVQNFLPKTTFHYTPGSAPACAKPTGLTVNYTGGTEAEVSWTSTATAWNIDVNGTVTAITENPYTLTGLDLATTYEVKVQADCGGGTLSEWTNAVSFTTDLCMPADQCELTFILTDSYGDGWNGAYIDVVDVATNTSLAHMSNQNIAKESKGDPETETYTLNVCDGRELQFVWHAGSFDSECSYVVNDVNGEEIFSGSGTMSTPVNYTVNCTVTTCKAPTDLAAIEIGNHSVKLNWIKNGEETEWVLAYSKDGSIFEEVNVDAKPFTLTGLEAATDYTVKVRPVCSDFDDKWSNPITVTTDVACPAPGALTVVPTPFSATVTWTGDAADYTLRYVDVTGSTGLQYGFEGDMEGWTTIDADGDGYNWDLMSVWNFNGTPHGGSDMIVSMSYYSSALTPDNYLVSPQITLGGSISFWVAAQDAAYPSEHFGVAVSTTGNTDAADFTTIQEWTLTAKGTGAKTDNTRSGSRTMGTWYQYTVDLSAYSGQGYVALRHFNCTDMFYLDVDDITIEEGGGTEPQWITVNNVTSPYEITGLDPETNYRVQVKALCGGSDGESVWASVDFQTPSNCTAPFGLAANVLTESATISWTGYQDSFNAQYRTAETREEYYFTNFNTDSDRTGWTWTGSVIYGIADPIYGYSSTENYFLQMGWATTSEATIISPELPSYPSGSFVEFYYFGYQTANTFQVGYSSTTNDYDAFTWGADIDAPLSTYTLFKEVIPDGTKYVAFKATAASNSACIFIDDFGIFGPTTPAGAWQPITNLKTTSVEITGLTAETDYEIQVQGINIKCDPDGVTDWSTSLFFTTLADEPIAVLDGGDWNQNSTWINSGGVVPSAGTDVYISGDVIIPAGYTAVAGEITIVNGGTLTIEEGGQLLHTEEVELTMNMTIGGYSKENPSGYNLIAAPTYTTTYYSLPIEGTNLNTGTFDLYYFDQQYDGAEWRNYKLSSNGFTDLDLGSGYLYANQGGAAITFTGNTLPTVDGVSIDLNYVDGKPFEGWNLVGNPYTCSVYIGSANTNTATTARPFYALEGTTFVTKAAGTPIAPMKGIFVEAENTGEKVYFFTTAPSSAKSTLDITVNQGAEMIDNAIIDFKAGSSLTKFQFNPNSTKVYMPVDGKDYAVVSAEEQGEMPVCFKAEENGTYTMSFTSENTKFSYLHLIDNMTGADVDLLVNPNYTFDARYTDYASRFKLVFATGNNDSESNFGFISDGNLMILGIEGEATLQMIDVTGRILSTETFSGSYSKALNASAGVYMLRLIQGENVRTQKIVVK